MPHFKVTPSQAALFQQATRLRMAEQPDHPIWFCPTDDSFADAARLWTHGALDRRWDGDELVYRASDAAIDAVEVTARLHEGMSMNCWPRPPRRHPRPGRLRRQRRLE
jgi:hypothetical protein